MKRVFASALLGLFLIPFAVASFASDWANWRDPLFEDVKRAYIFVDYHTSHIEENDVPEILRRQNIEKEFMSFIGSVFLLQSAALLSIIKSPIVVMISPSCWFLKKKGQVFCEDVIRLLLRLKS